MTRDRQQEVLAQLQLNWTAASRDVWEGGDVFVPQLHRSVANQIARSMARARRSDPLGLVVEGLPGTGKTQLLSWVREQVHSDGGFFFLIALTHGETFWENVVEAILDGLDRPHAGGPDSQLRVVLRALGERAGMSRMVRAVVERGRATRQTLDHLINALKPRAELRGVDRDVVRALAMFGAEDATAPELGRAYFQGGELDATARSDYGLGVPPGPERVVRHLSQVIALAGHSVMAIDQIDALLNSVVGTLDEQREHARRDHLLNQVAAGLMGLREGTRRTLTLLSCIPSTWALIQQRGIGSVADRFDQELTLQRIHDPEIARAIVEKHLGARYRDLGYTPPYPSWPVRPEAFATAEDRTPRQLLQQVGRHVRACLNAQVAAELVRFDEPVSVAGPDEPADPGEFAALDRRLESLRVAADVAKALDPKQEDLWMPVLLRAGIEAWVVERGPAAAGYEQEPTPGLNPPLHAGLRHILDEPTDAQTRTAFRAIAHSNARAVQSRLSRAILQSGIDDGDNLRRLFILRRDDWPSGQKTRELAEDFVRRGGTRLGIDMDDLRTLEALHTMLREKDPALQSWLVARKPASSTNLFRAALPAEELATGIAPAERTSTAADGSAQPSGKSATEGGGSRAGPPGAVTVGAIDGEPFWLGFESLRKHVAVFAGSGSGKTVLLRRLVEECALAGVSSIALDPNNDLARLGDAWPAVPAGWRDDDAKRAKEYLAGTDVVVWTPRRDGGRPLTFQPLPDFASVLHDADEFRQAVDVAVAALAPRVGAAARTTKAERQQAVLHEAVVYFARHGAGSLGDFIDVLAELPEHATTIRSGPDLGADMAQTLQAARVNDPLFGGAGVPVDPGLLLTPAPGKRARVSVISFVGLSEHQRPGFVSQLQMALFAWFKRHPAPDLRALLVMDEAQTLAPSGASTASTESTLILASQARKYGLGLVFATQAPKGLHNRIPGNASTQFFGYLNSPTQISTAQEIARRKGGDVNDISRLRSGEFYLAVEGEPFTQIRTYNCLSHHPPSPLSSDEVIARARQT